MPGPTPPPPRAGEASSLSSSRRGREDAIETLIDMDPRGAAYRIARTMVSFVSLFTLYLSFRVNSRPSPILYISLAALCIYYYSP